jgi:hypothetical protein
MAQLRGVDVLGQGVMRGVSGLGESVARYVQEQQRRKEVESLISGLMARSQGLPNKQGTDPGSPMAQGYQGVPMFSEQNFGQLQRLNDLTGGKGMENLQSLQPKFHGMGPGTTFGQVDTQGKFKRQGMTDLKPDHSTESIENPWRGEVNGRDRPIWTRIPGTNKTYQRKWKWVDPSDPSKGKVWGDAEGTTPSDWNNGNGSGDASKGDKIKVVIPFETEGDTQQRDFSGPATEISRSLQVEKGAIESTLLPYTNMGLDLKSYDSGDLSKLTTWLSRQFPSDGGQNDATASYIARMVRNWKRLKDKETEVNNAGYGVGKFKGKNGQSGNGSATQSSKPKL